MLTDKEIEALKKQGKNIEEVKSQIEQFKSGFPPIDLHRQATVGDGILTFSQKEKEELILLFEEKRSNHQLLKFVPASGAATRMFKDLYESLTSDNSNSATEEFLRSIDKFAFGDKLQGESEPLSFVLEEEGLNYANKPKGLIPFHKYKEQSRTPFQEHLKEGELYGMGNDKISIHFTVSENHLQEVKEHISNSVASKESKFNITYSIQNKDTDTIAVDLDNKPFFDGTEILFRPAGHGALIDNLNKLDADIVFIKNIDNVLPDRLKKETVDYKKAIGGKLIQLKDQIHDNLEKLSQKPSAQLIQEIEDFIRETWSVKLLSDELNEQQKCEKLITFLNRPIRVCGMVKNEGEPGGGPFWVTSSNGVEELQIVEKSQIDLEDNQQRQILNNSTHFNPVDLVCYLTDYKGQKFDLKKYTDPNTGFISLKSKNGKDLKAMELPGLWNGAMADWITLFVEVPLATFNPVKTVNDLLKAEHQ